jgi:hypothetical protein
MTIDISALRSIAQAAKALPFSEPAIRNRIARGELRTVKIAGYVFIDEAELRRAFGDLYPPHPAAQ